MEIETLKKVLLTLSKRAESYDDVHLVKTFVAVGNVPTLLSNNDSSIIFGRRGTGKTHLLSYINSKIIAAKNIPISIDMRTIGSSAGLYSDHTIPLSERATRLLRDTALAIHEKILEAYTAPGNQQFGTNIIQALDKLAEAASAVKIEGVTTQENTLGTTISNNSTDSLKLSAQTKPQLNLEFAQTANDVNSTAQKESIVGKQSVSINFGNLSSAVGDIVRNLPSNRLWVLLDEWSEVPLELQPYLADMFRRGFLSVRGVVAKIAAIEHRSQFRIYNSNTQSSIGIELGADVSTSLSLDDYMVFENDPKAASDFFSEMLFSHIKTTSEKDNIPFDVTTSGQLINQLFTQKDAFDEFVRASEGVPRDAINILSKCALKSTKDKISTPIIRDAARNWYMSSKHNDVSSRETAYKLLQWIIDEVIKGRKARGFLLNVKTKDKLIDYLFDSRVIHILKRSISSKEDSGEKYNAFSLDYGCYVELINTSSAPKGLFEATEEEASGSNKFIDIPHTDYRSVRRAILNLENFYAQTP